MNRVTLQQFMRDFAPEEIKKKIFLFAQESILTKNNPKRIEFFRIGEKNYSTAQDRLLKNFIPFRQNEIYHKVENPKMTLYNFEVPKDRGKDFIRFKKKITTYLTKKDIDIIRNSKPMVFTKKGGFERVVYINHSDLKNIKSLQFVNKLEISNFDCGLLISEKETMYECYAPYNNGCSRKYAIYDETNFCFATVSPLQMLWRIKRGLVKMVRLKEMARVNKIPGRTKLNTRDDYIKAFMNL